MNYIVALLFSMFLLSCGTDVSIMKTYENETSENTDTNIDSIDTGYSIIDTGIEDTEDTQTTEDLSNIVGYVEAGLMQAACPYCLGLPQEINTKLKVRLHSPTTASHTDWIPRPGSNCRDYYETSVSASNIDAGNTVLLSNDFGDNTVLNKSYENSGPIYQNLSLTDSNFRRNSSYSLTAENKTAQEVLKTLRGFDFIEPYTMLYIDPSYAFQAPIKRYGDNIFTWGPSGDQNSFFTIHVSIYSYDGSIYYGTVICSSGDTGYMSIPGSYFTQYQSGSLTSIHLMRHRIDKKQYSQFNGTIEGYSWWEVIGTGYIQ
jgi:hypothetical protein